MESQLAYRRFRFSGVDGTSLVGWTNDGEGPPLLVANGLGTPAEAWPTLLQPDSGYHVAGWNHRGGLGSERPVDPARIGVLDHVDDAFQLMDEMGWDSALVLGWSIGVNVAFEMAARHPERVSGIVGLAGVPGGTFEAGFAPLMVPKPLRRPLALGVTEAGRAFSGPLNVLGLEFQLLLEQQLLIIFQCQEIQLNFWRSIQQMSFGHLLQLKHLK